jgi:nucleoid DNA-binding protein
MTKPQLIESIATATSQPKAEIEKTLEAILDGISNALVTGDRVELRGLGILRREKQRHVPAVIQALVRPLKFPQAAERVSDLARNSKSD